MRIYRAALSPGQVLAVQNLLVPISMHDFHCPWAVEKLSLFEEEKFRKKFKIFILKMFKILFCLNIRFIFQLATHFALGVEARGELNAGNAIGAPSRFGFWMRAFEVTSCTLSER